MWRSIVVIAIASCFCAFSWRQWSSANEVARREAQLRREAEAEIARLETEQTTLRQQVASAPRSPETSPTAQAPGDRDGSGARLGSQSAQSTATVVALPRVTDMEVTRANLRMSTQKQYAPLIRELRLNDQEVRDLVELLAAEEFERTHPPDVEPSGPPKVPLEDKVESILGYQRMQAFRDYQGTMLDQVRAQQIATSLYAAGIPLTDQQVTTLAHAMVIERQAVPAPTTSNASQEGVKEFAAWQEDLNERVLDRMTTTLTNKQTSFIRDRFQTDVRTYRDLARQGNPLAAEIPD